MKCLHIALTVADLKASIQDYRQRLNADPVCIVEGVYALWRTPWVNLSITENSQAAAGSLRHLGFEDASATDFTQEKDCNGIVWEKFTAEQQRAEIFKYWPHAHYEDD